MQSKFANLVSPAWLLKNFKHGYRQWRGFYFDHLVHSVADPIFIVGCSRAGTTLLFDTLSQHPQLQSIGYELPQMWHRIWGPAHNHWHSEAAYAADVQSSHRKLADREYYKLGLNLQILDKTCINTLRIDYLQALYPGARFIYIYRDGRANVSSLMNGWRHDRHFDLVQFLGPFPEPVAIENGEFNSWSFFLPPGWRDYNQASLVDVCAYQWLTANQLARDALNHLPAQRWRALRYEDLCQSPVDSLQPLLNWLNIDLSSEFRQVITQSIATPTSIVKGLPSQDKWKKQNPASVEKVLSTIAPMMDELGYDY